MQALWILRNNFLYQIQVMQYQLLFLEGLGLTILAEILMGWFLQRFFPKYFSFKVKGLRFYFFIGLASFMTVPYVWFVWPNYVTDRLWFLALAETWVWIMEALVYFFAFESKFMKALLFSLILNGFSLLLGLLIFH